MLLTEDRFMDFVVFCDSGCWLWGGYIGKHGYGKFQWGTSKLAHRCAWEIFCGPIPDGLGVLHKCDRAPCVNPRHLFLGDQHVNTIDMVNKGRANRAFGENNGNATITEAVAIQILRDPRTCGEIANSMNLNWNLVDRIKKQITWKHLGER
jgi:hypothetical protein